MLTIGRLARGAGVSVDAVRYYEKEGLLAAAQRSSAGYRLYAPEGLRRLHFIRHAQQCGFSLGEIRELLELRARDHSCCKDVRNAALAKRTQLRARIEALRALAEALDRLIDACRDDAAALDACPILGALETTLAGATPPRRARPARIEVRAR